MATQSDLQKKIDNYINEFNLHIVDQGISLDDIAIQQDMFDAYAAEYFSEPKHTTFVTGVNQYLKDRMSEVSIAKSHGVVDNLGFNVRESAAGGDIKERDRRYTSLHMTISDRELYDFAFLLDSHIKYLDEKPGITYNPDSQDFVFKDPDKQARYPQYRSDIESTKAVFDSAMDDYYLANDKAFEAIGGYDLTSVFETGENVAAWKHPLEFAGVWANPYSLTNIAAGAISTIGGNIFWDWWTNVEDQSFQYWSMKEHWDEEEGRWKKGKPSYIKEAEDRLRVARTDYERANEWHWEFIDKKTDDIENTLDKNISFYKNVSFGVGINPDTKQEYNVYEYVRDNLDYLVGQYHEMDSMDNAMYLESIKTTGDDNYWRNALIGGNIGDYYPSGFQTPLSRGQQFNIRDAGRPVDDAVGDEARIYMNKDRGRGASLISSYYGGNRRGMPMYRKGSKPFFSLSHTYQPKTYSKLIEIDPFSENYTFSNAADKDYSERQPIIEPTIDEIREWTSPNNTMRLSK